MWQAFITPRASHLIVSSRILKSKEESSAFPKFSPHSQGSKWEARNDLPQSKNSSTKIRNLLRISEPKRIYWSSKIW